MKVALLSESSADEAALRILVDGILGIRTKPIEKPPLTSRGWPAVRAALPAIIRALHYRTEADGLVVLVDADHASLESGAERNRREDLVRIAAGARKQLRPVHARPPVRVAVGAASPAIEAWLLCHRGLGLGEAGWENGLRSGREPYSKQWLKKELYGAKLAPLNVITTAMTDAARELLPNMGLLERLFPNGFGRMAAELRGWKRIGG